MQDDFRNRSPSIAMLNGFVSHILEILYIVPNVKKKLPKTTKHYTALAIYYWFFFWRFICTLSLFIAWALNRCCKTSRTQNLLTLFNSAEKSDATDFRIVRVYLNWLVWLFQLKVVHRYWKGFVPVQSIHSQKQKQKQKKQLFWGRTLIVSYCSE